MSSSEVDIEDLMAQLKDEIKSDIRSEYGLSADASLSPDDMVTSIMAQTKQHRKNGTLTRQFLNQAWKTIDDLQGAAKAKAKAEREAKQAANAPRLAELTAKAAQGRKTGQSLSRAELDEWWGKTE